jgi:hypothetical protein
MRWLSLIALSVIGLAAPASAFGDGGPALPVQGGTGISAPGTTYAYVAVAAGRDATAVRRFGAGPGAGPPSIRVSGDYGVPGVGSSGQTTGLSADGHTLVLAELFGGAVPRTTRLLVLDTPRLGVRARIALPGWSVVDAISPDGRWLYLIHYPSYGNLTRYEVLAYDLVTRHLLAKPIVDPHDGGDAMTGFPVTRVTSADGRWAYTLYIRASGEPFIHALDTAGVRAVCVDLPASLGQIDIGNASLSLGAGGKTIRIDADGVIQAIVDTRTFTARVVHSAPVVTERTLKTMAPVARTASTSDSGGLPWMLLLAAAVIAAIGGAVGLRTRLRVP